MTDDVIHRSMTDSQASPIAPVATAHTNTILIVTDNVERAADIKAQLINLKFRVNACMYDGKAKLDMPRDVPQIILIALTDYVEKAVSIAEEFKQHYEQPNLPIVGTFSRKADIDTSAFESVIYPPAHPKQIAIRVQSLVRLTLMEHEILRRTETLREHFGIHYELTEDALLKPFKVLFVGKPTPEFMIIINSLQEKEIEVVAAFTTFNAFDYLYETQFDAVVMNALEDLELPLTITSTMRRNAKLYHVPTLLLIDEETFDQEEHAFEKGARDLIDANADIEEISGRILELANYHRIHSQLKHEFENLGGAACIDQSSGTFNDTFFQQHLKRVCHDLQRAEMPISLIAIKVWPNASYAVSSQEFSSACAQVGTMLRNLVRMQDIAARLENDVYLIAFPYETQQTIQPVTERISSIIDCAGFKTANENQGSFTVELSVSAVQLGSNEESSSLINRALNGINIQTADVLKAVI